MNSAISWVLVGKTRLTSLGVRLFLSLPRSSPWMPSCAPDMRLMYASSRDSPQAQAPNGRR